MGYLNLPSRIAVLSLGLLALAGCQEAGQTSRNTVRAPLDDEMVFVICPGDRRCGQMDEAAATASTCSLKRTTYKFKCGPENLPCPGAGCPTGEPGIEAQACRVTESFIDVKCAKSAEISPSVGGAPGAAAPPEPAPAPAAE